ncbi:MAG: maltose O-acetyltransferase [Phormidesmis priestleyi Ana]|uniref:Acetyltransferase n=1 Tax=Phormidesmis priestleyi Ana TaxID=1666911 RepID=A0A0N8KM36_9CYAN|nr:MAG: maltose O-acetyltransferase [Phormidesmis priestleyi Ana]
MSERKEKTEREKMLTGELYLASDSELVKMHRQALELMHRFNTLPPANIAEQQETIRQLFGKVGQSFSINPPFYCDYGCHIFAGENLYINYDCTILDCAEVHIGDNVLIATKVQIYAAYHPTDPALRLTKKELAAPVWIGNNVWIGGGAIICPGVSIGSNVTIGAGSVVTQSIPDNVVAVGNPCRAIKSVDAIF